jgi:hypothetical protein
MKQFLLALFILSLSFAKSQCSLTASTTPPSCPGNCDGSVVLTLAGAGCSAFPYNMSVNGGSCTPISATSFTAATMTFTGLCNCTSPYSVVLTNTLSFPVAFTSFAMFAGAPVTNAQFNNSPATCSACCTGSISTITGGGTGPYSYTWSPVGPSSGTMTNACPGVYTLCVSDSKGCTVCNTYTIGFSTGVVENEVDPVKIMYSKDEILITGAAPINTISVYDLTGRLVYKNENNNQKEVRLNKNQFNKGIYVMSVESVRTFSKHKIIIE